MNEEIPWILSDDDGLRSVSGHDKRDDCKLNWATKKHCRTFFVWKVCNPTDRSGQTFCATLSIPVVAEWSSEMRAIRNDTSINGDSYTRTHTSEYIDSNPSSCRRMVLDSFMSIVVLRSSSLCDELESDSASKSSPVVVDVMSPRSRASWRAVNGCKDPEYVQSNDYKQLPFLNRRSN